MLISHPTARLVRRSRQGLIVKAHACLAYGNLSFLVCEKKTNEKHKVLNLAGASCANGRKRKKATYSVRLWDSLLFPTKLFPTKQYIALS